MPIAPPTSDALDALVHTRHSITGIEYPPAGLQPYHDWLLQTLHLLAQASAGNLRVTPDADDPLSVWVAPGRASLGGVPLAWPGGSLDLASHHNSTLLIRLEKQGESPAIVAASLDDPPPAAPHLTLAEVTLDAGRISRIVDRRFETILSA